MRNGAWLVAAAAAMILVYSRLRQAEKQLRDLEILIELAQMQAQQKEKQRQGEHRGRVAAEKELRRLMNQKLNTRNGIFVQPVGVVASCFHSCVGTPRQGLFAPSSRGKIVFQRNISPDSLVELEQFSHVWIVFEFHKNTNGKNAMAHHGLKPDSHRHTFKAKITPPRLQKSVGIFSTRSPHRPNPIGITLAAIDHVDSRSRSVHVSGLDLVEGTPVLDIKPYVPAYDSIPGARVAPWVSSDLSPTMRSVRWKNGTLLDALQQLSLVTRFYRNDEPALRATIEEVLLADVRSKALTHRQFMTQSELVLDNIRVAYVVHGKDGGLGSRGGDVEILGVEANEESHTTVVVDTETYITIEE